MNRPECFSLAMDFLGDPEASEVLAYVEHLERQQGGTVGNGADEAASVPKPTVEGARENGWLEAAVAWEVCASIHRTWAKGKDALFKTRQDDFVRHAADARAKI